MSLYAIGDLHLDVNDEKPMNIFGNNWENHDEKIRNDWLKKVKEDDTVIIPGDLSWANSLDEAYSAFEFLNELPGEKILLKGNHDYWWSSLKKMNEFLFNNDFSKIHFLYNNSYFFDNYIIAGTRGWTPDDEKINNRENIRIELSIQDGIKKYGDNKKIIIVLHYPPTDRLIEIIEKYNVKIAIYGHLHGVENEPQIKSMIPFKLVSSDYLDFKLYKL